MDVKMQELVTAWNGHMVAFKVQMREDKDLCISLGQTFIACMYCCEEVEKAFIPCSYLVPPSEYTNEKTLSTAYAFSTMAMSLGTKTECIPDSKYCKWDENSKIYEKQPVNGACIHDATCPDPDDYYYYDY